MLLYDWHYNSTKLTLKLKFLKTWARKNKSTQVRICVRVTKIYLKLQSSVTGCKENVPGVIFSLYGSNKIIFGTQQV